MNDDHRRAGPAALALTAVALLAAACSGNGSHSPGVASIASHTASGSSSATSAAPASALAFAHCMRSHGLSPYPDPDSSGALPKLGPRQLGVSSSRFQAAQSACAQLLQPNNTQVQQMLSGMRDFARCMRSHGVPNWPDPTLESNGQAEFDLGGKVNPDEPPATTVSDRFAHLLHPAPGQDGVVLCNGIGEAGCHHYGRSQG